MNWKICPNCESKNTENVHTEEYNDMIERVMVCNDCPTQYNAQFELFDKVITAGPDTE